MSWTSRHLIKEVCYYMDELNTWKEIPNTNGFYSASILGEIRSNDRNMVYADGRKYFVRGKTLIPRFTTSGYLAITICINAKKTQRGVHQLIAETFIPNPNNLPCVLHNNDIKTDNRPSNLSWGTHKDNSQDCLNKGRHYAGNRKLNQQQVEEIKKLLNEGLSQQIISEIFNIAQTCISDINLGRTYKHFNVPTHLK